MVRAGGIADLIGMNANLAERITLRMSAIGAEHVRDMGAAVGGFELRLIREVECELRFHGAVSGG
jgi:hypothetical protein